MKILPILKEHGLIIATHNKGKLKEIQLLLEPLGIQCSSAGERGLAEPEETETTFEGNATLKACAAAQATGMPALADDSGLVVPALGGAPGIYSARWAGEKADGSKDFSVAFSRIQNQLEAVAASLHSPAYFICVLSLAYPAHYVGGAKEDIISNTFIGRVDGNLCFPPRGSKGFGYDPIFIKEGMDTTFAEINPYEKHAISHRADAFEKFLKAL